MSALRSKKARGFCGDLGTGVSRLPTEEALQIREEMPQGHGLRRSVSKRIIKET